MRTAHARVVMAAAVMPFAEVAPVDVDQKHHEAAEDHERGRKVVARTASGCEPIVDVA